MTTPLKNPPKLARWLAGFLESYGEDYAFHGDIEEIFSDMTRDRGYFPACLWYWLQILCAIPQYIFHTIFWSAVMIKNYFKTALRNILRYRIYSLINISGLAAGIACCILIFLWVKDELSFDRFHANSDELCMVRFSIEEEWWSGAPWALAPTLKDENPEVLKCTRFFSRNVLTKYEENIQYKQSALVDRDFFDMFSFPFITGDPETAFESQNSIVITRETAESLFGQEDPVGRIINVNSNWDLVVTGIIENVPENSHLQFDFLAPVELLGEQLITGWSVESTSYVLLGENIDFDHLREKIAGTAMTHDTRTDNQTTVDLQPITRVRLYEMNGTGPILYVYIFSTIAAIILLIASINYMNLTTARASSRAKEVTMRKIIGASKKEIMLQFYGESLLSAFIAMIFSSILVLLIIPSFNELSSKQLTYNPFSDFGTAFGLLGIVIAAGIISGSYPAVAISTFNPLRVIKGAVSIGSYKSATRRILVTGQFASTIILIIATIIMYNQLNYIHSTDLGLNKENIVVIPLNRELIQNYDAFKTELLRNSQVRNVTNASTIPTRIGNVNPVYWEGQSSADYISMNFVSVDYDYFETFGMEIVDGRSFSREFQTDVNGYVINEEAAKLMQLEGSPVGKMFSIWENEGEVLGVVKNFHSRSLHNEIVPIVFTLGFTFTKTVAFVKVQGEDTQGTIDYIQDTFKAFAPGFIFEYTFLNERFEQQYASDERTGALFRDFSILAIFISCLGILGLASFMAEQRTKEIGIRKVLGASQSTIVGLISKEFLLLIFFANLIAWPAGYYCARYLLGQYAYRTDIALWIFLAATGLTLLLALVTVSFQTIRAALSNPVDAIRYE
ncbi:ABC transporter permease [candidate division KSB1 bacterium]